MSEHERGQEAMLHNFRVRMKEIVAERTGVDGTIEQLHRVEDLSVQESEFWSQYEKLLRSALTEGADYNSIKEEADLLGKESRARMNQAVQEKKDMVALFYNWMNNRLAMVITNMYVLTENPDLIEEIKADLHEEFKIFSGVL